MGKGAKHVAQYEILRELGRGGMGVVYLARDTQLDRFVALKALNPHLLDSKRFLERFRAEARAIASLHHPNVVCVHSLTTHDGQVLIDMEYVDGQSLRELTRERHFTAVDTARLARDVLSGLDACHRESVIHRDIKPSNILVTADGTAKLVDFGIATAYAAELDATVTAEATTGYFLGTARYAPPEAWDDQPPTPAWDVYSLGLVLYELLTGMEAIRATTPLAALKQHLLRQRTSLAESGVAVSSEFAHLIDDMCGPADGRPVDASDVLERLATIPELEAAPRAVLATVPFRPRRPWPKMILSKGRLAAFGGVLFAAIAATGAIYLAAQRYTTPPVDAKSRSEIAQGSLAAETVWRSETLDASDGHPIWWRIEPAGDGRVECLGVSSAAVYRVAGSSATSEREFLASGRWAQHRQGAKTVFGFGNLEGIQKFDEQHAVFVSTFTLQDTRTNLQRAMTLVGERDTTPGTPSFWELTRPAWRENHGLMVELLERKLDWALELEFDLRTHGVIHVLPTRLSDVMSIAVDGRLDEPVWPPSEGSALAVVDVMAGGGLAIVSSDSHLFIGLSISDATDWANIDIALAPIGADVTEKSPRIHASRAGNVIATPEIAASLLRAQSTAAEDTTLFELALPMEPMGLLDGRLLNFGIAVYDDVGEALARVGTESDGSLSGDVVVQR